MKLTMFFIFPSSSACSELNQMPLSEREAGIMTNPLKNLGKIILVHFPEPDRVSAANNEC